MIGSGKRNQHLLKETRKKMIVWQRKLYESHAWLDILLERSTRRIAGAERWLIFDQSSFRANFQPFAGTCPFLLSHKKPVLQDPFLIS